MRMFDYFTAYRKMVMTNLRYMWQLVMRRYVTEELCQHYAVNRQMLFLSGPRQVGKTTIARQLGESFQRSHYLNWDNFNDRELILKGPEPVARHIGLDRLQSSIPFCAFDELHKYRHWRDFLKGLFDQYEQALHILVTGSAHLDTFKRSGDSLMGRYFPYTLHPVSVAELAGAATANLIDREPKAISGDEWESLCRFGGFPEPMIRSEQRFYTRWRKLRAEQLFREDLRDLTRIQELGQLEMLAEILLQQAGQLTSYTFLSKTVRVAVDTVRRWVATLESLYYCFSVKPWYKNVTRALRKEPKYYLWDWSQLADPGARAENLVACALLKATHWWTESGQGDFGLHFVRDKEKREVDFLVTRDQLPWFLVEVKSGAKAALSNSLAWFQSQTQAEHAFQVAMDLDYVEADCFAHRKPIIVPARTLLAQLV
jgi:hypothetical protein